jgi:hypothetical protein
MSSAESALWISLLTQLGVACVTAVILYRRVKRRVISKTTGKTVYSWLCLVNGVLVGPGIFSLFPLEFGRGEILFAATLEFALMTVWTLNLGRIYVGWIPIEW